MGSLHLTVVVQAASSFSTIICIVFRTSGYIVSEAGPTIMFSTLRYTADSTKEAVCIEQASNPPGQSHGQQHSACNHCRAKKVRSPDSSTVSSFSRASLATNLLRIRLVGGGSFVRVSKCTSGHEGSLSRLPFLPKHPADWRCHLQKRSPD